MAWDKTLPLNNSKFGVSPGYLRNNWDALEDTIGTDHYYMGQSNDGKHKYVSLVEQSSAPTTAASVGAVYTKDSGTQPELFFREESSGDEVQLTSNGALGPFTSITAASGSDLSITAASGQDILITIGDNAGANKVSFLDTDAAEVAYIDSDGSASFDGDVTIGNDLDVTGDITIDGDITIGGANVVAAAWCSVVAESVISSYNIASVSKPGANVFRVTFTSSMAGTTYAAIVGSATDLSMPYIQARATTYVDIKAITHAGATATPYSFDLVIYDG